MTSTARGQMWVDVYEAARTAQSLEGGLALDTLPRVFELRETPTPAQRAHLGEQANLFDVDWSANFFRVNSTAQQPQSWLKLRFRTKILQSCVRCLEPVLTELDEERQFVFAGSEERAAELDEDLEMADVLVGSRHFDLAELVEDELILALPALPRHPDCDLPLDTGGPVAEENVPRKPFDALKVLTEGKNGRKPG